jgi:hypothetical protein
MVVNLSALVVGYCRPVWSGAVWSDVPAILCGVKGFLIPVDSLEAAGCLRRKAVAVE